MILKLYHKYHENKNIMVLTQPRIVKKHHECYVMFLMKTERKQNRTEDKIKHNNL